MVNGNIKAAFGMFLLTKLLQQRFFRCWKLFSGLAKIKGYAAILVYIL